MRDQTPPIQRLIDTCAKLAMMTSEWQDVPYFAFDTVYSDFASALGYSRMILP
jgi:hypothetical protein